MTQQERKSLSELRAEYAPLDLMACFDIGFSHHGTGVVLDYSDEPIKQQAFDRGAECAMRWQKMQGEA